jgi:DNA-binding MarR family transcriptional regulator
MTQSYNSQMAPSVNPRLENLLASLSLNLADESQQAMERASGLAGSGTAGLLALGEFLGGAHVGMLADVLGLTHSGAVRMVALLEKEGLAERRPGHDRRQVEVRLTPRGRRVAKRARDARSGVLAQALADLDADEAAQLEALLDRLVRARVRARMERRRAGEPAGAWWCRTCDLVACGRPEGRCPAQLSAVGAMAP